MANNWLWWPTKASRSLQPVGKRAEQFAKEFLVKEGLSIIAENVGFALGEIDIIAEHGDELVFVEVRFRANLSHGSASESVSTRKQGRLIRAAQIWLQQNQMYGDHFCRFDVVSIDSVIDRQHTQWHKNAFEVDGF